MDASGAVAWSVMTACDSIAPAIAPDGSLRLGDYLSKPGLCGYSAEGEELFVAQPLGSIALIGPVVDAQGGAVVGVAGGLFA